LTDLSLLLAHLAEGQVSFVLIGGLAAVTQGAPVTTFDVDVVHERSAANVSRLLAVLTALDARYRSHPDVRPTSERLLGAGHQLLTTSLGPLDLLGAVEGGLDYEALLADTIRVELDGNEILVLRLEKLLEFKRQWSDPESKLRAEILARTIATKK
jgi:predicted nucleotidyltransferase